MYASNSLAGRTETLASLPVNEVLKEVCELLPDAFIALNSCWRITYLNQRAKQVFCNYEEELQGQHFWHRFPEFANSIFRSECERAIVQQTEVHFEQFYLPFGVVLEARAKPSQDGLLIYLRDVTSRKQAEATLLEQSRLAALSATISTMLGQQASLIEMLDQLSKVVTQALPEVALFRLWLWNEEQHLLEMKATAGNIQQSIDLPQRISLGISIVGLIAQNRQPYLTNDLSHELCIGNQEWIQKEQLIGFAGYPLIVDDKVMGVMALFSHLPITEATRTMLQWIANGVAIAIDRAHARAELLSQRESLLFRLANDIRNSLDLDKILNAAVHEIRRLLQIDRCHFIWCWANSSPAETQAMVQPVLCVTHEAKHPDLVSLLGECPTEQVTVLADKILNLESVQVEDIEADPNLDLELRDLVLQWGTQSYLLMPLETRSGHLGAIVCGHCQHARHWSESEVELLRAVTDQLAIAIDQAELYAQSKAAALAAQTQAEQLSEALKHLRQTQAQLIQSEKMSSLGQLVAGIAHEINNPVTFVSGNLVHANSYFQDLLDLLKLYQNYYPQPIAEIQEHIEAIDLDFVITDLENVLNSMRIGADRICKIVQSLRNFSRLDEAEVKAVDLHEGIDSTLLILQNRLKPRGQNAGIQLVKEYGTLPLVNCYASQLNQVFMNILSNAIDALESAPPPHIITIRTEHQLSEDHLATSCVVVRICDNGIGMSEETRRRIFDPFYTTKPVGQGTGLGLSISHQIVVEKHKGQISCLSTPGAGTEFIIEIPV